MVAPPARVCEMLPLMAVDENWLLVSVGSLLASSNAHCAQVARMKASITLGSVGSPSAFTAYTAPMAYRSIVSVARLSAGVRTDAGVDVSPDHALYCAAVA
jgi:hypothetical protein